MMARMIAGGMTAVALAFHARLGADALPHDSYQTSDPMSDSLGLDSHRTFFEENYPSDLRPPTPKSFEFQHPFPIVQDTEEYDKDFIKDENSDGGQWKAQAEYDALRRKQHDLLLRLKRSQAEEHDLAAQLNASKQNQDLADEAVRAAQVHAKEAQTQAETAASEVSKLTASADGTLRQQIDGGVRNVEAELTDLEACKKKFKETNEKLRQLIHEKENKQKLNEQRVKQAEAVAVAEEARANSFANHANAVSESAKRVKAIADEEEQHLLEQIVEAKKVAMERDEEARLAVSDVELSGAAARLQFYNLHDTDSDGGVYYLRHPEAQHHVIRDIPRLSKQNASVPAQAHSPTVRSGADAHSFTFAVSVVVALISAALFA